MEIWESLIEANVFQKTIFGCLVLFSILSWAIFFYFKGLFSGVRHHNRRFEALFQKERQWQVIENATRRYHRSFFAKMYHAFFQELAASPPAKKDEGGILKLGPQDINGLERTLEATLKDHVAGISHPLRWLASIANTAPFIGLLGTVVGIIRSFQDIAQAHSASLATVAPGIAEALVMTAVGLAVAIPAVIFFNLIRGEIVRYQEDAFRFGAHLLNRLSKDLS
jgi:biopolymer transport protein ExbB/TolQ